MGLFAVPRKMLAAQHIYALCADEPKENELPVPPNAVSCVSCRPFHRYVHMLYSTGIVLRQVTQIIRPQRSWRRAAWHRDAIHLHHVTRSVRFNTHFCDMQESNARFDGKPTLQVNSNSKLRGAAGVMPTHHAIPMKGASVQARKFQGDRNGGSGAGGGEPSSNQPWRSSLYVIHVYHSLTHSGTWFGHTQDLRHTLATIL